MMMMKHLKFGIKKLVYLQRKLYDLGKRTIFGDRPGIQAPAVPVLNYTMIEGNLMAADQRTANLVVNAIDI